MPPSPPVPRSPSAPGPGGGDAVPILRALAASVYAPTAIFAIGSGAVQPVLVLAAVDAGMSHSAAASVVGLVGLVGVVSAPVAGVIVARLGGRRTMALGTITAVLAAAGILTAMSAPSFTGAVVFAVGVALQAASANLWALARQGYIADAVPAWARARALSFLGGMMRLGVLVGPAIGSGAIILAGRRGPFVLHILTSLGALWLVLARALPTRELRRAHIGGAGEARTERPADSPGGSQEHRARRSHSAPGPVSVVAVAITCLQLLRINRTVLVPLWGAHLGLSDALISATFAAGALVDVAMFLPSGRWMDRYGRLAGILPALFIMGASLIVTIMWTSTAGFVVGTCLMGFGNGFGSGIVMTMGADLAPPDARERFLGWWQGIGNIGTATGPFVVSALTAALGLTAGMWATALLGVIGGAWAWLAVPRAYTRAGIDLRGRPLPGGNDHRPLSAP